MERLPEPVLQEIGEQVVTALRTGKDLSPFLEIDAGAVLESTSFRNVFKACLNSPGLNVAAILESFAGGVLPSHVGITGIKKKRTVLANKVQEWLVAGQCQNTSVEDTTTIKRKQADATDEEAAKRPRLD